MIDPAGPYLSLIVVGVLLAAVGQGINGQVFGELGPRPTQGWRERWRRTMWAHPIIAGGMMGWLTSLPAPEGLGDGTAGRVVWYAVAGALALSLYGWLRRLLEHKAAP